MVWTTAYMFEALHVAFEIGKEISERIGKSVQYSSVCHFELGGLIY
jgi:hypothetical protein